MRLLHSRQGETQPHCVSVRRRRKSGASEFQFNEIQLNFNAFPILSSFSLSLLLLVLRSRGHATLPNAFDKSGGSGKRRFRVEIYLSQASKTLYNTLQVRNVSFVA